MRWRQETVVQIGNSPSSSRYFLTRFGPRPLCTAPSLPLPLTNRGESAPTFTIIVEFFPCKAKLADGSVRDIDRDTSVRLDVELSDIDPLELEGLEEKAVQNLVERIGESIVWGPDQEVSLQRFDNWKGEYVRIEDGEQMVEEIDQQEGWERREVIFYAEQIDLKSDSKVGYVQSKMAAQIADDEWAADKQMLPLFTEPTVLDEESGADADAEEGCHGARNLVTVDWNLV